MPVFVVQSEWDVLGVFMYVRARQPDSDRFRLWEVAGSAHSDSYFLFAAAMDTDGFPVEELAAAIGRADDPNGMTELPMNSGPQMHYVVERAVDTLLDRWVRDGTAPPVAARLEVNADEDGFVVDAAGLARGGVRSPWVDAPAAVVSGLGQPGDMTALFGTTRPLDATIAARYPDGRDQYVREFRAATRAAVDAGFLLAVDAPEIDALGALAGNARFGS